MGLYGLYIGPRSIGVAYSHNNSKAISSAEMHGLTRAAYGALNDDLLRTARMREMTTVAYVTEV